MQIQQIFISLLEGAGF